MAPAPAPTSWQSFQTAVQFLTRIPLKGMAGVDAATYNAALRQGVKLFPLVGGLIGCFTAALFGTLSLCLPSLPAALIAIGIEMMITGAFHEDAFADTFDAFGGGWTRDQTLEIMKDSRLGTYGTSALIIAIGLRAACMASLLTSSIWLAMIAVVAASTLGRAAIVLMMATTNPISDRNSQARDVAGTQDLRSFVLATLITAPLWIGLFIIKPSTALTLPLLSGLTLFWFRRRILQRVGGTTGDLLGCTAMIVQLLALISASIGI